MFGNLDKVIIVSITTLFVALTVLLLFLYLENRFNSDSKIVLMVKMTILLLSLSILGGVSGYSGGMSRTGVVGDIIPAVLGLLGGISVYLFGVQNNPNIVTPLAVIVFAVSLVAGFSLGTQDREKRETFSGIQKACISLFMSHNVMDEKKLAIANREHGAICTPVFNETKKSIISK